MLHIKIIKKYTECSGVVPANIQLGFARGTMWTFCEKAGFSLSVDAKILGEKISLCTVAVWYIAKKKSLRSIFLKQSMRSVFSKWDFTVHIGRRRGGESSLLDWEPPGQPQA